jgi:hypothetical protein
MLYDTILFVIKWYPPSLFQNITGLTRAKAVLSDLSAAVKTSLLEKVIVNVCQT